jgi:DNA-directed RNA polymerase beta subunit
MFSVIDMDERKMKQNEGKQPSFIQDDSIVKVGEETLTEVEDELTMISEETEDVEEFDFDDVLVLPAEGLLIKHNDEEVRLLFFYVKPSIGKDQKKTSFKAVTELRIPHRQFLHIASEIQQIMKEYHKNDQTEPQLYMYG